MSFAPRGRIGSLSSEKSRLTFNASSSSNAELGRLNSRPSIAESLAEKYSLSASPRTWGTPIDANIHEEDDELHNPSPHRDRNDDSGGTFFSLRGLSNLGCMAILVLGLFALFAGYPIGSFIVESVTQTNQGGFNLGGINSTGQVPDFIGNYGPIDKETPKEAYTKPSYNNPNEELVLVFSDEFNTDGRTFYPGDDPYWEAVDLWYWGTINLEWYDPSQVTTGGGYLRIKLEQVDDRSLNHNQSYKGGMLQSWNKFCFTGGLIEASVRLPGSHTVGGLWPALWTMGNLGRAGFGASLEGMWPYSYDTCDVGTLANQTYTFDKSRPVAATVDGDRKYDGALSFLPGQRLSACTCEGESHPGPVRPDGSYVGRAAPEIDVFEAIVEKGLHEISQSAQWAPYNARYRSINDASTIIIHDDNTTHWNSYVGGAFQQTTSGLVRTNPQCYEASSVGCLAIYGFEYKPGFDDGYITWISEGKRTWTLMGTSMAPDTAVEIGARPIPLEPMYMIANLGISTSFGEFNPETIELPAEMTIDWIRVYQPSNAINVGCDPKTFPTAKYIETYLDSYVNPNLTIWSDTGNPWPVNRLTKVNEKCDPVKK